MSTTNLSCRPLPALLPDGRRPRSARQPPRPRRQRWERAARESAPRPSTATDPPAAPIVAGLHLRFGAHVGPNEIHLERQHPLAERSGSAARTDTDRMINHAPCAPATGIRSAFTRLQASGSHPGEP